MPDRIKIAPVEIAICAPSGRFRRARGAAQRERRGTPT
jgi:hypothetical protein